MSPADSRIAWLDRVSCALGSLDPRRMSTDVVMMLALVLESLGDSGEPRRPTLTLIDGDQLT